MGSNNGIYIDNNLTKGCSYPTKTFDSPCLTTNTDFIVGNIEIWGFDPDIEKNLKLRELRRKMFN